MKRACNWLHLIVIFTGASPPAGCRTRVSCTYGFRLIKYWVSFDRSQWLVSPGITYRNGRDSLTMGHFRHRDGSWLIQILVRQLSFVSARSEIHSENGAISSQLTGSPASSLS